MAVFASPHRGALRNSLFHWLSFSNNTSYHLYICVWIFMSISLSRTSSLFNPSATNKLILYISAFFFLLFLPANCFIFYFSSTPQPLVFVYFGAYNKQRTRLNPHFLSHINPHKLITISIYNI